MRLALLRKEVCGKTPLSSEGNAAMHTGALCKPALFDFGKNFVFEIGKCADKFYVQYFLTRG